MGTARSLFRMLVLATLALGGCYDAEFPEADAEVDASLPADAGPDAAAGTLDAAACDTPQPAGDWQLEMHISPSHLHPGVVATFTFDVAVAGQPVSNLTARVRYGIIGSGKAASFPLKAGDAPGTYTGVRVLSDPGAYELFLDFTPCATPISRRFTLNAEAHP